MASALTKTTRTFRSPRSLNRRRAFTLIEMLIAFFLAMFILSAFYLMHGTYQRRLVKIIQKSRGQQAVRLFMTKVRQELKGATKVYIPTAAPTGEDADMPHAFQEPRNDILIMVLGRSNTHDYNEFTIKYEYIREKKAIRFSEYENKNKLIRTGIFLGGNTQILGFHVHQTEKIEQILIQKHKVDVEIEYYDVSKLGKKKNGHELVIPLKTNLTVYPRPINMLLRIDVPQG